MKIAKFALLSLLFIGAQARADQCVWMDASEQKYVADSARKILLTQKDYITFCENCGDAAPSNVMVASKVHVVTPEMAGEKMTAYKALSVDGKELDLAYLYIRTGSRVFTNAALLTGCPATGASPVLFTAPGKSPHPISWEEFQGGRKPDSVKH